MKSHTPGPGFPRPKKPKRNTQANIAMSITFLMPNFFMKNGISRMQRVSEICPREMMTLALLTPQAVAKRGLSLKDVM